MKLIWNKCRGPGDVECLERCHSYNDEVFGSFINILRAASNSKDVAFVTMRILMCGLVHINLFNTSSCVFKRHECFFDPGQQHRGVQIQRERSYIGYRMHEDAVLRNLNHAAFLSASK